MGGPNSLERLKIQIKEAEHVGTSTTYICIYVYISMSTSACKIICLGWCWLTSKKMRLKITLPSLREF